MSSASQVINLSCTLIGYNSDEGFIVHVAQGKNVSSLETWSRKRRKLLRNSDYYSRSTCLSMEGSLSAISRRSIIGPDAPLAEIEEGLYRCPRPHTTELNLIRQYEDSFGGICVGADSSPAPVEEHGPPTSAKSTTADLLFSSVRNETDRERVLIQTITMAGRAVLEQDGRVFRDDVPLQEHDCRGLSLRRLGLPTQTRYRFVKGFDRSVKGHDRVPA
ncbi:hypothetical protein BD779DRAFT_1092992 [Infundibulicybe gibba]|nr:hypothetical protein BD779DRAFT_1092992 [Infundibulicybe gibba]